MTEPRISIVVLAPADEAARRETVRSLEEQAYPCLEIVLEEEGASAARALNAGFARATGEILGYLKRGERLLPGSLRGIAAALGTGGRDVVMGRALYVAGDIGVEHPREYLGHRDHLAIWTRRWNAVPQSSVFWRRAVLERSGPFDGEAAWEADYDFICRVGRLHAIHSVDEPWSACELATAARADDLSEEEQLARLIAVSRRYWGSWLSPLRWRCEWSHHRHERHWHERARHHARRGEAAAAQGRCIAATLAFARTWLLSPRMATGRWKRVRDACRRRGG